MLYTAIEQFSNSDNKLKRTLESHSLDRTYHMLTGKVPQLKAALNLKEPRLTSMMKDADESGPLDCDDDELPALEEIVQHRTEDEGKRRYWCNWQGWGRGNCTAHMRDDPVLAPHLKRLDEYDAAVHEVHHTGKLDSPSAGTCNKRQ